MIGSYPHLCFGTKWELGTEVQYRLGQCRGIIRAVCGLPIPPRYHKHLLQISLQRGALATTAIEGNTLTEAEVRRVAAGESLPESKAYQEIEVRNVLEAMNELLQELVVDNEDRLISPELITRFHRLIGKDLGEHLDAIPGRWREDARIVGSYRCPDHRDIPELIDKLCSWLPRQFGYPSGGQDFGEAVIEAIVGHVYLEWIHPFGDGNGRTGRLLEYYILLRAGLPSIATHILSNFYNDTRPEYYRQLDRAQRKGGDLTGFIAYATQGLLDGLIETLDTIHGSVLGTSWRSYIYERFGMEKYRKGVFKRRRDLALSMAIGEEKSLDELSILTPGLARQYVQLGRRTLERDVAVLEKMDLMRQTESGYRPNVEILTAHLLDYGRRNR